MADEDTSQDTSEETFSENRFYSGAWIVYINGIEIPVSTARTEFGIWQIPTAELTLQPDIMLQRIGREDRMQVQICYLDEFYMPNAPRFCLLGEFEVVGWGYMNSGTSRYVQLDCVGQLQILQQLQMFYMSSVDDIAYANGPVGIGDPNVFVTPKIMYPYSLFLQGLAPAKPLTTEPTPESPDTSGDLQTAIDQSATGETPTTASVDGFITRPIEFIKNVIASLTAEIDKSNEENAAENTGNTIPKDATSVPSRNFFKRWMDMTGFPNRWVALPGLEDTGSGQCFSLLKSVQNYELVQAATQQLIGQSVGNVGSIYDLLKSVLDVMYMELDVMPAPPLVSVDDDWVIGSGKAPHLASHFLKPISIFGIPPKCNIIFPSMIQSVQVQESYINQPTRIYLGEKFISKFLSGDKGGISQLTAQLLSTGYPPTVRDRMQSYVHNQNASIANFLLWPEEFFKGPVSRHISAPPWLWFLQQLYEADRNAAQNIPTAPTEDFLASAIVPPTGPGSAGYVPDSTAPVTAGEGLNEATGTDSATQAMMPDGSIVDLTDQALNISGGAYFLQQALLNTKINEKVNLPAAIMFYSSDPGVQKAIVKRLKEHPNEDFEKWARRVYKDGKKGQNVVESWDNFKLFQEDFQKHGTNVAAWEVKDRKPLIDDPVKAVQSDVNRFVGEYNLSEYGVGAAELNAIIRKESTYDREAKGIDLPKGKPGAKAVGLMGLHNGTFRSFLAHGRIKGFAGGDTSGLGALFDLYAQYEYYRSRYAERNATLNLAFNPYIVPGFPAFVFDQRHPTGLDFTAYVTKVIHSFSADGKSAHVSTQVMMSYVRTMKEYKAAEVDEVSAGDYAADVIMNPGLLLIDSYPPEPIPDVLTAFQITANAAAMYHRLFYRGSKKVPVMQCALDLADLVMWRDRKTGKEVEESSDDLRVKVTPKQNVAGLFDNYTSAMKYISRPVCTLNEYVGSNAIRPGNSNGPIELTDMKGFVSTLRSSTATYGSWIYQMTQGPGKRPSEDVTNMSPSGKWKQAGAGSIAQTRSNWQAILRAYRHIALATEGKTGLAE